MQQGTVPIAEAIKITGAEKSEFEGAFIAECCGSKVTRGNAYYGIYCGDELDDECCTKCLKRLAHHRIHQYDKIVFN